MSTTTPPTSSNNDPSPPTIYFAFGSNLWLHQMSVRCPSSQYLGLALLPAYRWIINERGYANVVAVSSSSIPPSNPNPPAPIPAIPPTPSGAAHAPHDYTTEVWGMVYSLSPTDEAALDRNEGVPHAYTKHFLACDFWALSSPMPPPRDGSDPFPPALDTSQPVGKTVEMLVYVDTKRVEPGEPREEYVYRMNRGVGDAVRCGVPEGYVEGVVRGYIPADDEEGRGGVEEFARGQARGFRDESGVF